MNQLISYYSTDSAAANLDSVGAFLNRDRNPGSKLHLAELYIRQGKMDSASALLDFICLDSRYDNYCLLQNLFINLKDAGLTPISLRTDSHSLSIIEAIAIDSTKYGYNLARNLLSYLDERHYPENFHHVQPNILRKNVGDKTHAEKEIISIFPDPAYEKVTISVMPSDNINRYILISNLTGKLLKKIPVSKETEFEVLKSELGANGIYLIKLLSNNQILQAKKLIFLQ